MNLSVRQLRAFTLAAQHASFSAAAAELGISQPGFSLLIRQLEEELGLQLFQRTTRRVELTAAGREMLDSTQRALNQLDAISRHASDLHAGQQGRLTVAVIASVACSLFPAALAAFQQQCPGVSLMFQEEPATPLLERVLKGDAEIGWGLYPTEHEELAFEPLYNDPMVVVMHASHPLAGRDVVSWQALKQHKYISAPMQSGVRIYADRAAAEVGIEIRPDYLTSSLTTGIALVRNRVGCAVLPQLALQNLNLGQLVIRQLEQPGIWRENGLITRRHWPLSPAAQTFANIARLTARAARQPEPASSESA